MRLPLLVCAKPANDLKNHIHITPGRWRVEFDGLVYSTFKFILISPTFPEGFELDFTDNNSEFYTSCPARISCSIVHVSDEKMVSIYLRRVADGVQYHANAKGVASTSG